MALMDEVKNAHYFLGSLYYLQGLIKCLGTIVIVFVGGLYFLFREEHTIALLLLTIVLILLIIILFMYVARVLKIRQSISNKKLHVTLYDSTYECKENSNEYSVTNNFEVCAVENQVDRFNFRHSFSGSGRVKVFVEPREFSFQNQRNIDDGNFQFNSIVFPRHLSKNERLKFKIHREYRGGKTKPKPFYIYHVNDIYPNGITLRVRLDREVAEFTKEVLPPGLSTAPIRRKVVLGRGSRHIEWVIEKPCVAHRYKIAWR